MAIPSKTSFSQFFQMDHGCLHCRYDHGILHLTQHLHLDCYKASFIIYGSRPTLRTLGDGRANNTAKNKIQIFGIEFVINGAQRGHLIRGFQLIIWYWRTKRTGVVSTSEISMPCSADSLSVVMRPRSTNAPPLFTSQLQSNYKRSSSMVSPAQTTFNKRWANESAYSLHHLTASQAPLTPEVPCWTLFHHLNNYSCWNLFNHSNEVLAYIWSKTNLASAALSSVKLAKNGSRPRDSFLQRDTSSQLHLHCFIFHLTQRIFK